MTATQFPYIPCARPMPVQDRQLAQLAQVAEDALHGNAEAAACEWLVSACGPLLRELMARRQFMAGISPVEYKDNVAFLPKVR